MVSQWEVILNVDQSRPVTALKSGPEMPRSDGARGPRQAMICTATALSALRPVSRLGHSDIALFFWSKHDGSAKFRGNPLKSNFSTLSQNAEASLGFSHVFPTFFPVFGGGRVFHLRWPPSHRICDGERLSWRKFGTAQRKRTNRLRR